MNDNLTEPSAGPKPLRPWTRRLWMLTAGGLVVALCPLAITLIGMAFDSPSLQSLHWLIFYSVPIATPVVAIAGLTAMVMTVQDYERHKNSKGHDEQG
jgi:hypothetical protein